MISSEIGQSECDDILSTHPKSFTGMVSIKYVAAFSSNRELETQPLAFATTSKKNLLFQGLIFRFHVKRQGCNFHFVSRSAFRFQHRTWLHFLGLLWTCGTFRCPRCPGHCEARCCHVSRVATGILRWEMNYAVGRLFFLRETKMEKKNTKHNTDML